ncbi:MAG TPA: hypothetical protein VK574_15875 [Terracidiphilus sp.]|nr:hypothetical protein [Terracidiphilus sp.]
MFSFRRSAGVLAVISLLSFGALAQSTDSSSSTPAQEQPQGPAAAPIQQGQQTVQARIRARREARRAQAIHDAYSHLYEVFVGGGYQRFTPGPGLQRVTMYSWDVAVSRFWTEKLGLTFDGRGYYGTAFVGLRPNNGNITRPAISTYDVLVGPTYRFRMRPKYSIAGSVKGGVAMSNFASDTNGFGTAVNGLYPDGTTYAINASLIGEVNISPSLSLRLAPDYMATGFGSTLQNDLGFTYGFVYRFGKQ